VEIGSTPILAHGRSDDSAHTYISDQKRGEETVLFSLEKINLKTSSKSSDVHLYILDACNPTSESVDSHVGLQILVPHFNVVTNNYIDDAAADDDEYNGSDMSEVSCGEISNDITNKKRDPITTNDLENKFSENLAAGQVHRDRIDDGYSSASVVPLVTFPFGEIPSSGEIPHQCDVLSDASRSSVASSLSGDGGECDDQSDARNTGAYEVDDYCRYSIPEVGCHQLGDICVGLTTEQITED